MTPIFVLILLLSTHLLCESTTTSTAPADTTTSGTVLIRRRIPASRSSSGGRYSLLNSRVNRRLKKKNLDPDQLLDILGGHFDARWMSSEDQLPSNQQLPAGISRNSWHKAELEEQLRRLNLSSELGEDAGEVEKWLLKKASCPVRYEWQDIGPLFFPRFVLGGSCPSPPGTCSFPPGMHCVPAGTTTLHVLRWQCKMPKTGARGQHQRPTRKNYPKMKVEEQHLRCSWIVVPYPVTTDCMCTC